MARPSAFQKMLELSYDRLADQRRALTPKTTADRPVEKVSVDDRLLRREVQKTTVTGWFVDIVA